MTVGFNRRWIGSAVIYFIVAAAGALGVYSTVTRDILIGDDKMTDTEKYIFITAFAVVGTCAAVAFIKLIVSVCSRKGCFTVNEDGISDTFVILTVFAFCFVFSVKNIPWEAVKSIRKDELKNTVHARIDKKHISEITASPIAKAALKAFGFDFGQGFADVGADEIIDILDKYKCLYREDLHG